MIAVFIGIAFILGAVFGLCSVLAGKHICEGISLIPQDYGVSNYEDDDEA